MLDLPIEDLTTEPMETHVIGGSTNCGGARQPTLCIQFNKGNDEYTDISIHCSSTDQIKAVKALAKRPAKNLTKVTLAFNEQMPLSPNAPQPAITGDMEYGGKVVRVSVYAGHIAAAFSTPVAT